MKIFNSIFLGFVNNQSQLVPDVQVLNCNLVTIQYCSWFLLSTEDISPTDTQMLTVDTLYLNDISPMFFYFVQCLGKKYTQILA